MKADLAGKTGEHKAGQVLSRSDRYRQWLDLGCSEMPLHQESAPERAAAQSSQLHVMAVRCLEAPLITRWLARQQSITLLRTSYQQGK